MFRTKSTETIILHLLIWLLNYILIAFVFGSSYNGFDNYSSQNTLAYAFTYGILSNFILFYVQVFWLVPKFYLQYSKAKFYLLSIAIIILVSLIEIYCDYRLYDYFNITDIDGFWDNFVLVVMINMLYSVAGFYYIFKRKHKKAEEEKQLLIEESLKTELAYLKAQLNPHFLFNGINNIYHLIGKDNALAKETLLQFSSLLRYQLYESGTEISLEKELDFVLQYIKLEKTRKGSDILLHYDIEYEDKTRKIVPLLLIPFIENAFKHCSSYSNNNENVISIRIKEESGELSLLCSNTYDGMSGEEAVGGIGLNNVKRRLSLVYPDKHQLDIKMENSNFVVDLWIEL